MKSLFDGSVEGRDESLIKDSDTALRYIVEIEVPVCLNLGLCYNKLEKYHHAIKFCSQALDKDEDNEKALYRRGFAYLNVGELSRAKKDLVKASEMTDGSDSNINKALQMLKQKQE